MKSIVDAPEYGQKIQKNRDEYFNKLKKGVEKYLKWVIEGKQEGNDKIESLPFKVVQ